MGGEGLRGGGFEGKALYFCGGGRGVAGLLLLLLLFQSSGRLAFVKMYNFLQVVVILKNAVLWVSFVQMRSFRMKQEKV